MRFMVVFYLVIITAFAAKADNWELTWSEEFDYIGLPDTATWSYEIGYERNNEKQYYTENKLENARVKDGMLIIKAHHDTTQEHPYTSASIHTWGKAHFKYGRIEVKAKLPTGTGTWPAIWMLGTNRNKVGWPECGEIDIMENVGFDPDVIHGNIHTEAYNHVKKTNKGNRITVSAPYQNWHIYSLEWSPEKIDIFIDEQKYFTFDNERTGTDVWPFDQEFYLIINLAIGGSWGGQQGIDDRIFPQRYFIDYVRAYKKQ